MIILLIALLSYAALALDSGGGTWSLPAAALPQFLYLAAAVSALLCRTTGAVLWAALTGLCVDVVTGGPLGLNVVVLANLTFLSHLTGARRSRGTVLTTAAFILLYATAAGFASLTLRDVLAAHASQFRLHGISAVSRAGGTAACYLVAMLAWVSLVRLVKIFRPRPALVSDRPNWAR